MRINKLISFVFQFITIGLAAAFVIMYLYPEFKKDVAQEQHVVELKEAQESDLTITRQIVSYADAVAKAAPAVVNIYTQKIVTEQVSPLMEDPLFRYFF